MQEACLLERVLSQSLRPECRNMRETLKLACDDYARHIKKAAKKRPVDLGELPILDAPPGAIPIVKMKQV